VKRQTKKQLIVMKPEENLFSNRNVLYDTVKISHFSLFRTSFDTVELPLFFNYYLDLQPLPFKVVEFRQTPIFLCHHVIALLHRFGWQQEIRDITSQACRIFTRTG